MWPFIKNKFKKLKKQEVTDAIYKLEKQEQIIEDGLLDKQEEIQSLLERGKKEKSYELRLFYAKKINHLKQQSQQDIQRGMYLLYNVRLLNKLKDAIEDKEFYVSSAQMSLGNLLKDQKGLAQFLNQALNTKIAAEDVLTSADETFCDVESAYEPSKQIYGQTQTDDQLLAVFEDEEIMSNDTKSDQTVSTSETISEADEN